MRALLLPVALFLLAVAVPGARADGCKQAGPLPQSKCTKDSQCCPGLVCQAPPGPNKNNATMQCMGGCRIGGGFQTPGQRNTAPNNCQSCQPSISTTAWTNLASGTPCRSSAGVCDTAESCTGASGACPSDTKSTAVCRSSAGACDLPESCNGVSNACPADAKSTAVCRSSAGACDLAESCNGVSNDCPADAKSTAVCRSAAGACDLAESCNGVSNDCPADAKSTAVCRSAQGTCDVAESCDGTSNDCAGDGLASSTVVCRQSTGDCDAAENCTGTSVTCPTDVSEPDGTSCTDGVCMSGCCNVNPPPPGPDLLQCDCADGAQIDLCVTVNCASGPAQDALCGPACQCHGGEALTGCFPANGQCATSTTTTTSTPPTTTTTIPAPGCFRCPPEDELGFAVAQRNEASDPIFCSYPAVEGEDPFDFYCTYSYTTGVLVEDHDAGLCQPNAVNTCSS